MAAKPLVLAGLGDEGALRQCNLEARLGYGLGVFESLDGNAGAWARTLRQRPLEEVVEGLDRKILEGYVLVEGDLLDLPVGRGGWVVGGPGRVRVAQVPAAIINRRNQELFSFDSLGGPTANMCSRRRSRLTCWHRVWQLRPGRRLAECCKPRRYAWARRWFSPR